MEAHFTCMSKDLDTRVIFCGVGALSIQGLHKSNPALKCSRGTSFGRQQAVELLAHCTEGLPTDRLTLQLTREEITMAITLRTFCLSAVLLFAALSTAKGASTWGTCTVVCFGSGSGTTVRGQTTYNGCCSRTWNPCPAGTMPGGYSFQPDAGPAVVCPIAVE